MAKEEKAELKEMKINSEKLKALENTIGNIEKLLVKVLLCVWVQHPLKKVEVISTGSVSA